MISVNTLKKPFFLLALFLFAFVNCFNLALAESSPNLSLSFNNLVVKAGQTFSLNIVVQNQSTQIYDAAIDIPNINNLQYCQFTGSDSFNIGNMSPSQSKTVVVNYKVNTDAPENQKIKLNDGSENLTVNLNYKTSSDGSLLSTNASTGLPTVGQAGPKIASMTLPSAFTKPSSITTSLSSVTNANAKAFPSFTLDDKDMNIIKWIDPIDLTDTALLTNVPALDKVVDISTYGQISVNTSSVPALNKKATITFRNLKYKFLPTIFKDSVLIDPNSSILKNLKYDEGQHTLAFDVDSFSTYQLGPSLKLDSLTQNADNYILSGQVSDPTAIVDYSYDGVTFTRLVDVDIESGKFKLTMPLNVNKDLFVIRATKGTFFDQKQLNVIQTLVTPTATQEVLKKTNESSPPNFLLIYALLAAVISLGVLVLVGIIIFKRLRNVKLDKKKEEMDKGLNDISNGISNVKIKVLKEEKKEDAKPPTWTI